MLVQGHRFVLLLQARVFIIIRKRKYFFARCPQFSSIQARELKSFVLHQESCDEAARLARTFSNSSLLRRFSVMLLLSSNFGRMTAMYPLVDGYAQFRKNTLKCFTKPFDHSVKRWAGFNKTDTWTQDIPKNKYLWTGKFHTCLLVNTGTKRLLSRCFYLLQQKRRRF